MRYLVLLILIAASLLFYSMGIKSGFVALLLIGLAFEMTFWFKLSSLFGRSGNKSHHQQ